MASNRQQRRRVSVAIIVMASFVSTAGQAAQRTPPDVDALLARLDDLYRSKSSIARLEVQVMSPRSTRSMRMKAWTRGEDEALILIEAPAREEGTATLRVGPNLWNYLPRIARTIRVPPSMMLGSWMGTDFTNDDLVKESSLRKDFNSRVDRRQIAALKPEVVIPGHQVAGAKNDLSAVEFMKTYMQDWDKAVAASKNADELAAQIKKKYPRLGMENLLTSGAQAAFQPARGR